MAVLLCGCRSVPELQFGIYAAPEKDLHEVKQLGINFVVGPKKTGYLTAAEHVGLKVLGTGNGFPAHRALIGNYLSDEPDLFQISPETIAQDYFAAKQQSPKPVFLNLSSGYSAEYYADHCDVVMFDWYPVGWQPLETYYANLRVARLAARRKPLFAVVQAFDWSRYPKLMPPRTSHRPPTAAELKAMTLWAAMSGAIGIAFYAYDDGYTAIKKSPDLTDAIKDSIQTIRHYERFFVKPRRWAPYPFRFTREEDKYNAISETSIAVKCSGPELGSDEWLIVAANTTSRFIEVSPASHATLIGVAGSIIFEPLEVKFIRAKFQTK